MSHLLKMTSRQRSKDGLCLFYVLFNDKVVNVLFHGKYAL